jgi:hypothetical protein
LQTGFLTVAVLPVRVICIAILLAAAWLLACVGLIGVSEDDIRKIPLTGWRRYIAQTCPDKRKSPKECVCSLFISSAPFTIFLFPKQ